MKKHLFPLFFVSFVISGCSSHLAVLQQDKHDTSIALEELRIDIADLKHAQNNTQVELQILDEQVKKQDHALKAKETSSRSSSSATDPRLTAMEKKLSLIERQQEKILTDLQQLSQHANQTSSSLNQYRSKIQEIEAAVNAQNRTIEDILSLKSTLQALSQTMGTVSSERGKTYKVKPGDSLEKIARLHKTSVEAIQRENNLSNHRILVGQELAIP